MDDIASVLCLCGCGEPAEIADRTRADRNDVKGRPKLYARGHRTNPKSRIRPCAVCGQRKPEEEFYKSKGGQRHYRSLCKVCDRLRAEAARALVVEKRCCKCQEMFPASQFPVEATAPDGLYAYCKECRRKVKNLDPIRKPDWYVRSKRYAALKLSGLTYEEVQAMEFRQKFLCAICHQPDARCLALDHDHKTGVVRDLLCGRCNTSLGGFRDSETVLRSAIKYLKKWEAIDEMKPCKRDTTANIGLFQT